MTIGALSGSQGTSVNKDFEILKECKLKVCVQFGLEVSSMCHIAPLLCDATISADRVLVALERP